ncbi:PAS domain S-box protein [Ramlibacter solisilvae]|uniref:Histidine kinase n=2 Tax=Ramlibacter tataouinensis TaxID=94132 RepID=A0A127JTJ2_9BURK|nr:PAS domain S-box protein [Ramlibacter tataouinensis]AMO23199.1 histidine kinase [Ramlibacter tataouinensis]
MATMTIDHEELIQAIGDAVVVAGTDGNIAYWNPAATRIFGFTEDEAMGRALDLIIPERQRARHNEGYAKTVATGTTRYGTSLLRVPALHKDGRRLSIAFTVALLQGEDGGVSGVAAVIRDETERFEQDQQLRKRLTELEMAARA